MDRAGTPLTPLVTHADRRSVEQARRIEREIGRQRHLATAGNRPYPGGIASTTWRWYAEHAPELLRPGRPGRLPDDMAAPAADRRPGDRPVARLVPWRVPHRDARRLGAGPGRGRRRPARPAPGRPRRRPGRRRARPGRRRASWACEAASRCWPAAWTAAPRCSRRPSRRPKPAGPPAAASGAPGLLVNSVGSTDVLAMAVDRAEAHAAPAHPGARRRAGAGSPSPPWPVAGTHHRLGPPHAVRRPVAPTTSTRWSGAARARAGPGHGVRFRPYLAGDRTTLNQPRGGFSGLTLATTREHLLAAVLDGLAAASAARLPRLAAVGTPLPVVYVTGGAAADVLYRDWPRAAGRRALGAAAARRGDPGRGRRSGRGGSGQGPRVPTRRTRSDTKRRRPVHPASNAD